MRDKEATMDRRSFLGTATATAATLAFPAILRAQGGPIKIGFPLPLTGPFGAIATDQQRGAILAIEQVNARGGVLGRQIEVLFRDDQLKPAVGAQRTKELIENEKVDFIVGGLAAHVQMAINEQAKAAGKLFISISQSDEISAKPDSGPLTFHEALNPTITGRAVGGWGVKNLGKAWWIVYADYAWGKQNDAVFTAVVEKAGGKVLGHTPYPLGKPEFSTHIPKILAAKPEVVLAAAPGTDSVAFAKQAISFGLKKQTKLMMPLHFVYFAKEGGADLFADVYAGTSFYWELESTIPQAKKYVEAFQKRFKEAPDSYSGYGFSGIMEVVRGVELAKSTNSDAVATALLNNPTYDHYKGKEWWRKCDRKSFQDLWILKGRSPAKGEWGYYDIISKVPADEALDRTCAEKGYA
jgi:branched-chain amino acid transport system substrate-binding protein